MRSRSSCPVFCACRLCDFGPHWQSVMPYAQCNLSVQTWWCRVAGHVHSDVRDRRPICRARRKVPGLIQTALYSNPGDNARAAGCGCWGCGASSRQRRRRGQQATRSVSFFAVSGIHLAGAKSARKGTFVYHAGFWDRQQQLVTQADTYILGILCSCWGQFSYNFIKLQGAQHKLSTQNLPHSCVAHLFGS